MLQTIINGLLIGGVMALGALGFTLIFGVMGVLNLTHGAIVVLGAYSSYFMWVGWGIDPFLSVPITMVAGFTFGYLYQRSVIQSIIDRDDLVVLLVTYGIALVVKNLLTIFATANSRSINPPYSDEALRLAGLTIPVARLGTLAVSLVVVTLVFAVVHRTRFGLAVRATAESSVNSRLCGIDVERVYALTFGLATAISAASGSLIGVIIPFSPTSELFWTLNAFVVVVLGGLGSLFGSLVGGLVLGLTNSFTTQFAASSYVQLVTFSILILVLLFRPQGLFGRREDIE